MNAVKYNRAAVGGKEVKGEVTQHTSRKGRREIAASKGNERWCGIENRELVLRKEEVYAALRWRPRGSVQ